MATLWSPVFGLSFVNHYFSVILTRHEFERWDRTQKLEYKRRLRNATNNSTKKIASLIPEISMALSGFICEYSGSRHNDVLVRMPKIGVEKCQIAAIGYLLRQNLLEK